MPELPPELLLLPQPWMFEDELPLAPELLPELLLEPQPWMFWLPEEEPEDDEEP
jgi:hypothetical protein